MATRKKTAAKKTAAKKTKTKRKDQPRYPKGTAAAKKKALKKKAPKRTPAQVGRHARRSGHDWERKVVNEWKDRFSDRVWAERVRRTDQGHRAALCDVHGVSGLWQECAKGSAADHAKKMAQAVRDNGASEFDGLIPVTQTRPKIGKYETGIRLRDLATIIDSIRANSLGGQKLPDCIVRMDLPTFMDIYDLAEMDDGQRPTPLPKEKAA